MIKAIIIAVPLDSPVTPVVSTTKRQRIKGMQLPIYPQAYPWEEMLSIRSGVVMSESIES